MLIGRTYRFVLLLMLSFVACQVHAQVKSGNIQTIEGKKYYIHRIEKGQSLYAISKLYSVSVDELYRINPALKSGAKAGQEIKVPHGDSPAPPTATVAATGSVTPIDTNKYVTYKTQKSETIYSLSKKFKLTEAQLLKYNPSLSAGLKEGQLLIVGEKKKRVYVKEPREIKQISIAKETPTTVVIPDTVLQAVISKPKKQLYNVALILPFRIEQTLALDLNDLARTNSNFPPIPGLAIDFYLGFKRAVDSLTTAGFSVNIQLFDVDDKDTAKIFQLSESPQFKELDMIFGPLYANGFKTIAKKAKEFFIPVISPITTQNKILYENICISKTNPSQFTLLESLAMYCMDSLVKENTNIILMALNDKDRKEMAFVNAFRQYYNDMQKLRGKLPKDTIALIRGISNLKPAMKPDVPNVVVSLSNNQVFVIDFTTQLAVLGGIKNVTLCGWQNITEMDNIDQEYLNQLNFTFPHQFNITNYGSYSRLVDEYKNRMQTSPGEYFFIGFDIALYYLGNLKESGPDFAYNLDSKTAETNYMRFRFSRPDKQTGFDNRGVYIFKYDNYQLRKTGWK